MLRSILLVLLLAVSHVALAQDTVRYVTDELAVMLRQDRSADSQGVGLLVSGTRLELLESDSRSGYARVRAEDGRVGWVLERYLRKTPIARDRVEQLERQLADNQAALKRTQAENEKLRSDVERLSAGRPVVPEELIRENDALRKAMAEYERERERIVSQYDTEQATQNTLALGGILVGSGALLALLLHWLWPRPRRGWGDL